MMNAGNAQARLNKAVKVSEKYQARKAKIGERVAARRAKRPDAARVKGEGRIAKLDRKIGKRTETINKAHAILRPAI